MEKFRGGRRADCIWVPWTIEHTQLWEEYEQEDSAISYFRRNEYFEDMQTLLQRDAHWHTFCDLLHKKINSSCIFPSPGFAILDKQTHELLGTIQLKLSSRTGYLSLSYGLKKTVRDQKLGSEIAFHIKKIIDLNLSSYIPTLKQNVSKNMFMAEWYEQGKQEQPNFDTLLDFFESEPILLKGFNAFVDINNQPSLAILHHIGIQPVEIECTMYHVTQDLTIFCFSILLSYPTVTEPYNEYINTMIHDILSRDAHRIQQAQLLLQELFKIPSHWQYLALNREEKKHLKYVQSKSVSTLLLSDVNLQIKTIDLHESCLIN